MKKIAKRLAEAFGYEVRRKADQPASPTPPEAFHTYEYLRHNARRLEHLASLRIPVADMTVLELGAGIGDHTGYYLDRGCNVVITESRLANLNILSARFPGEKIVQLDMEAPQPVRGAPFDVIHCYGLLYHLKNPEQALKFMGMHCRKLLFLETCVSFGSGKEINLVTEDATHSTQAVSGLGSRPTRPWIFEQLQRYFPHVYCPRTQPNHDEFPLDWTAPAKHHSKYRLQRSVFVASRHELANDVLIAELPELQTRHE
jgi:Methyltransferase domain